MSKNYYDVLTLSRDDRGETEQKMVEQAVESLLDPHHTTPPPRIEVSSVQRRLTTIFPNYLPRKLDGAGEGLDWEVTSKIKDERIEKPALSTHAIPFHLVQLPQRSPHLLSQ